MELAKALDQLDEQLADDESNRLLALRLEKIRIDRSDWVEGGFDNRRGNEQYSQAFAKFAILKSDASVVAAELRASPINEQLVAALDDWASCGADPQGHGIIGTTLGCSPAGGARSGLGRSAAAGPSLARPGSP